jgi:hypothetical protein
MDNATLWKAYVGERTRREFLEHWHDCTLQEFVRAYVAQLPHVYGVTLRNSWRETFASQPQLSRDEVAHGLLRFLEEQPDEWADLPAPRPPSPPVDTPSEPAPAPEAEETPPPPEMETSDELPGEPGERGPAEHAEAAPPPEETPPD